MAAAATVENAPFPGDPPADGQLVTVRNRVWVVSSVTPSSLATQPGSITGRPTHVVVLVSIEDDARDEELRVVWELERGAVAHDQHTLQRRRRVRRPGQLDAFLDAVRWGAIASADKTVLQAPFRSGVSIADYQLDPVVRALSMPRTNLLIADDVGLGKTIEADLVMQELTLRHRARTMLIVCPPCCSTVLSCQDRLVPLPGYREQFMAQPLSGTASGLDRVAVGTQRDHLLRMVRAAHGEILDVIHFQDRVSGVSDVLRLTRAARVLAVPFAAQQHGPAR